MENYFEKLAQLQDRDVLIVCDRGTCDTFAYSTKEVMEAVLEKENWDMNFLNYQRYDKVIHMVTAANGAEEYFGYENQARSETKEEAIEIDRKIQNVWFNNPQYKIIDNSASDFNRKIDRVINQVSYLVSFPVERFVRKFLLKDIFTREAFDPKIVYSPFKETIVYLPKKEAMKKSFIVCREFEKTSKKLYFLKNRKLSHDIEKRVETSRQISKKVYNQFFAQRDYSKNIISKDCFSFKMEDGPNVFVYKIETIITPNRKFSVLHSTASSERINRAYPSFVKVLREVTDDSDFFTHRLAKLRHF